MTDLQLQQALAAPWERSVLLPAFLTSLGTCLLLVTTQRWHGHLTHDGTHGIQKFHDAPTPRVGGIPIVMAVVVAVLLSQGEAQSLLAMLLLAGVPAFAFGLAEDVTKRVGILHRLLATMASGVLGWWMTGHSLTRVDVPGLDVLLQWLPLSLAFTALAVGGVANAINIIDGCHGLASTMASLAFLGLALMAAQAGDSSLAAVALMLAACTWGFFWVNWPMGKIFLGDGGAYFTGFAIGWLSVLLVARNPGVSAFAVLMLCIHPVTEVLFSMYRRKMRQTHPGMPDRLHFHSLLKRRYVARWLGHASSGTQNAVTGLLVGLMTLSAVLVAPLVQQSVAGSALACLGFALGYVAMYARMVRHRWCSPVHFLLGWPAQPATGDAKA